MNTVVTEEPMSGAVPQRTDPPPRGGWWRHLAALGPGIVLLLSSIGPRDLITNSVAGANYGYRLLWIMALAGIARYLLLEASARYVIATGETLLSGFRRIGGPAAGWLILIAIFLKRHLSNLYHILLMGMAFSLLTGQPSSSLQTLTSVVSCALAFGLMYLGGYRGVERFSKFLALLLGGSLLTVAVASHPDWGAFAAGLFTPAIPEPEGGYGPMIVILMLLGGNLESVSNLKYSAFIFEKGWRDPSHLKRQRFDLATGLIGVFVMAVLIQVAAAAVLQPRGLQVKELEDLVAMFTEVIGPIGRVLLAVSVWVTVFTTYLGSNTGYSLLTADLIVPAPASREEGASQQFAQRRRRVFRYALLAYCLPPLYVFWTSWKPVALVVTSAALFATAVPLVVIFILILTNDRNRMGAYANSPLTNLLLLAIVVLTGFSTWEAVVELVPSLR
jgi:Mn2+/Fe2+ NRAMP family transporter